MADRPRKSTRLTVSLEEQDYDALTQIALASDVSLSWVIRQAVRQFIDRPREAGGRTESRTYARDAKRK